MMPFPCLPIDIRRERNHSSPIHLTGKSYLTIIVLE
jgi:hypothetical protein